MKRLCFLFCLVFLAVSATGCGGGSGNNDVTPNVDAKFREVNIELNGFPMGITGTEPDDNYDIIIFTQLKDGALSFEKDIKYLDTREDDTITDNIEINEKSERMVVYLYRENKAKIPNPFDRPDFVWSFLVSPDKYEYKTSYYLTGSLNSYEYGIHRKFIQPITFADLQNQDFKNAPYFAYELTEIKNNSTLEATVNALRSSISFEHGESLEDVSELSIEEIVTEGNSLKKDVLMIGGETTHYFLITPENYDYKNNSHFIDAQSDFIVVEKGPISNSNYDRGEYYEDVLIDAHFDLESAIDLHENFNDIIPLESF